MEAIQAARELGRAIQKDARYIRIIAAQENNDKDAELQRDIGTFNGMRGQLNDEVQKEEKDTDKIKQMDADLKALYQKIFDNKHMQEFTEARNDFQEMLTFINQIISGSASGENPDTIELQANCGGDCGGCSGCS